MIGFQINIITDLTKFSKLLQWMKNITTNILLLNNSGNSITATIKTTMRCMQIFFQDRLKNHFSKSELLIKSVQLWEKWIISRNSWNRRKRRCLFGYKCTWYKCTYLCVRIRVDGENVEGYSLGILSNYFGKFSSLSSKFYS